MNAINVYIKDIIFGAHTTATNICILCIRFDLTSNCSYIFHDYNVYLVEIKFLGPYSKQKSSKQLRHYR